MTVSKPYTDGSYTRNDLRAMLPTVGDVLKRKPEFGQSCGISQAARTLPCTVVYVHPAHLWYRVEFKALSGGTFYECYKVPDNITYDQKYDTHGGSKYLECNR